MSDFKYTHEMKKYQVLAEAMKYLDDQNKHHREDKYEFVCNCINRVVNANHLDFKDKSGLISIINERIFPENTFCNWLYEKHSISFRLQDADEGRKLQYTRKMWMQSMYEEFLSKDE